MSKRQPPVTVVAREEWEAFAVELRSDGLVQVLIQPETEVDVEQVKKIVEATGKVTNGSKAPVLVLAGEYTLPTADARNYIAEPGNSFALAEAYVLRSLPQKIVGDFFLRFNNPGRPTRIFTQKEQAIQWLMTFIR